MKKAFIIALLVPFSVGTTAIPALGQVTEQSQVSLEDQENAQERINFSGKLRMLSQRIPSAACHLSRGIDTDGSKALLVGAAAEFEKILTALEFGDTDLNIQNAETRRMTLAKIHELHEKWTPLKNAADAVAGGTATDAEFSYILTENMPVLAAAQLVVEELVQQYSNPNAVTRASLMLVDISGRQRMLTQKVSKETCILGGDNQTPETLSDIEGTIRIFEASLEALRFGMPAVGVGPPPNPEISAGLEGVLADWQSVRPLLSDILAGDALSDAANVQKFQGLNTTMANMNTVVGMYGQAAGTN